MIVVQHIKLNVNHFKKYFNIRPFEATVSTQPADRKIGLRSEMGLAVMMFPATACVSVTYNY